jgi:hypothetical protein
VDIEDVRATMPLRKPKEDTQADDRPTPDEPPADTLTLAALDAHIETLKAMAAKADEIAQVERQRADIERVRADTERARADAERIRADALVQRIEDQRNEDSEKHAIVERDLLELRSILTEMQRPRSWWKRLVG